MPRMLGHLGRSLGFVAQEAGTLDGGVPAALHRRELLADVGTAGVCLGGTFTQGGELTLEGRAFSLQRAQRLRARLQLLLQAAYDQALLAQAATDFFLRLGPTRQLGENAFVLRLGALTML